MKEAVYRMRVDGGGRSAHNYLDNEYRVLNLIKIGGYPKAADLFSTENNRYLILEYFESISLREYIHRRHVAADYNRADMHRMGIHILDMVQQCHDKGIVINDLTPNNIVVLTDGSVRLIDLELAYVRSDEGQAESIDRSYSGLCATGT